MTGFGNRGPQQDLHVLRSLPGTEGKATFSASRAVLDLLGLTPADAAGLDLADVLHLIRATEGD
ncbi:hypothetical protein G6W61_23050 [Streptomyces sp. KAI-26]|uniref:hypothetical protein n=1 Tax=unclassified Streptomyces TaxID=2593676 RepID=UPI001587C13A|nr:hypothetical protein [Streptomyces sp. KAI-26]NUV89057.1 hypothetical protein [Streptomyces sp. KAI-26]NUW22413.1 hypothetical protein [Streptomyces roseoviolaceus]